MIKRLLLIIALNICVLALASCSGQEVSETMTVDITMEGGSGKAYILSPVTVTATGEGMTATLVWSSPNYDYMIVDGVKYINENPEGDSTFTIPVKTLEEPLDVIADTTAMSVPHEIEYVIRWEQSKEGSGSDHSATDDDKPLPAADIIDDRSSFAGMSLTGELSLKYARMFSVYEYGDYTLVSIKDSGEYLIVPEGMGVPADLPQGIVVLKKPFNKTYLASSSVMDLIRVLDCIDRIRLTSTKASDWYIDEARTAIENGDMLYAGRYRAPDYELILGEDCSLAIENTMIYHEPAVKEKLEELGIPVLVEMSSYEEHPLGRLEWIKLYGILFDREKEAEEYYEASLEEMRPLMSDRDAGVTVAFFHINANGTITVRQTGDYITQMIEMAGGHYLPDGEYADSGDGSATSTMNMLMEDFYTATGEADIIIYNSTIGGGITSIDELVAKESLFKDFKAVKSGQVYCTTGDFFQKTTAMPDFMKDLSYIFTGSDHECSYLVRLENMN